MADSGGDGKLRPLSSFVRPMLTDMYQASHSFNMGDGASLNM
jgi:hypothetical protein